MFQIQDYEKPQVMEDDCNIIPPTPQKERITKVITVFGGNYFFNCYNKDPFVK